MGFRMSKSKVRYEQLDRAMKLNKVVDKTIPFYDGKNNTWCLVDGTDKYSDMYLDRLIQKFAGYKMQYRYTWLGETVTRKVFAEVLEDVITRYEDLNIDGFEVDYNRQQLEWLTVIKNKLITEQKRNAAEIPHYCKKNKEWQCMIKISSKVTPYKECGSIEYVFGEYSGFGEKYNFMHDDISKDEKWPDHEHDFAGVVYALISSPNHFSVNGFEGQYSIQQLELLKLVKEKLLTRRKANYT